MKNSIKLILFLITIIGLSIFNSFYFYILYNLVVIPVFAAFAYTLPEVHWTIFWLLIVGWNSLGINSGNKKTFSVQDISGFIGEVLKIMTNKLINIIGVVVVTIIIHYIYGI